MRLRLKLKELCLLVPALGLIGGAFYWGLVESNADGHAMFVESVELAPASGVAREAGYSHSLKVTIDHPWPKPRFWTTCCSTHESLDSFQKPIRVGSPIAASKPDQYIASLGEVIWKHDGHSQVVMQDSGLYSLARDSREEGKYVFRHSLMLQKIGPRGEVVFHGAYIIAGKPALEIRRVIRHDGEKFQFESSRATDGSVLSISPTSWQAVTNYSVPVGSRATTTTITDNCDVVFRVRRDQTDGREADSQQTDDDAVRIYDLELSDGKGRIYKDDGLRLSVMLSAVAPKKLPGGRLETKIRLCLYPHFAPPSPLTLRGKVSIDDHWPLPFAVHLKPR